MPIKDEPLTKEYILKRLDAIIQSYALAEAQGHKFAPRDHHVLRAIRFVLKNRTEENWGPKELTMEEAMRLP